MLSSWGQRPFEARLGDGYRFVVRRELFERIPGKMDEAYFLYMEDVDLCARIWAQGRASFCARCPVGAMTTSVPAQRKPFSWAGRMHLKRRRLLPRNIDFPCWPRAFVPGHSSRLKMRALLRRASMAMKAP